MIILSNNNVKFYSKNDLSTGHNLLNAEKILNEFRDEIEYNDINIVLEFYNIQLYLENNCYLNTWDKEIIAKYKDLSMKFDKKIGIFFSKINEENITNIYKNINSKYLNDFFTLFEKYKIYTKISDKVFEKTLNIRLNFEFLLRHKKIVAHYDKLITQLMLNNINSCTILLNDYLALKTTTNSYYFPKSLNKEDLINSYINSDKPNINYLNLIINSSNTNLYLSDKTRLNAKRKYDTAIKNIFSESTYFEYGVKLTISEIQVEPVNIDFKDRHLILTYSKTWLENNLEYPIILIYNFIYIFGFVDHQIRFTHVHKLNSMSIIEKFLGITGITEYVTDISFNQIEMAAQLQMKSYYNFLKNKNVHLEDIYKWFFEVYLKNDFEITGFYFNPPSLNSTFLEKIRTLNSEIDSLLKQFKLFVENKTIDRDLLQISSKPLKLRDIPSLINKKYIYPNNNKNKFQKASILLCSDQSTIHYISEEYNSFENFYQLINNYNLTLNEFHEYQKSDIHWLIDEHFIYINDDNYLKCNADLISIIEDLYFNDVLSYYHLDKSKQLQVDSLLQNRLLRYENTLFSKPEYEYLNYILNKADFSNGLDLRNKYIHGTQTLNVSEQEDDYFTILRVLELCILKINDEFCLYYDLSQNNL